MKRRHWITRTIRRGRVRIYGVDYAPTREPFPARFEGVRADIGLYWNGDQRQDFAHLHSQADVYEWPGIFCDADGYFRWEWLEPVEETP